MYGKTDPPPFCGPTLPQWTMMRKSTRPKDASKWVSQIVSSYSYVNLQPLHNLYWVPLYPKGSEQPVSTIPDNAFTQGFSFSN